MEHTIGIIGFGGMGGGYHCNTCFRDDIPFKLTAVYDLREECRENARQKGVKAFDNLQDFLDSHLFEMVVVATSNNNHCPLACAALEAGYHVMVEKPAALTSGEIETMIETGKRCGKLFTVHQNRRWDRNFLIIKKALEAGLIGKPYVIENRVVGARGAGASGMFGWRDLEDHGGGMLLDWGVHMLDQVLYLIDEPIASVYAEVLPLYGNAVDDYSKIIITFASGLVAQVEVSTGAFIGTPKWYIQGDQGGLVMQDESDEFAVIRRSTGAHRIDVPTTAYTLTAPETRSVSKYVVDGVEELHYPPKEELPPQDWASLYLNLAGVLDGTEELVVKPEQVLRCFKVIEAARRSAVEKRSIQF